MPRQLEKMEDTTKQLQETKLPRSSHIKKSLKKEKQRRNLQKFYG